MRRIDKQPKFSIIIPIYNEEKNIPRLLANLSQLEGDFESIFVDGGSHDRSLEILREYCENKNLYNIKSLATEDRRQEESIESIESIESGHIKIAHDLQGPAQKYRLIASEPGRGQQMNAGAREARGEFLVFLHADSSLGPGALLDLERVLASGKYQAAVWRLAFDSRHPLIYLIGLFASLRIIFRQIAFGDQGLMIRREIFDEMAGFPDLALMEDYEFSIRFKAKGYKIGLGREKIITSARRFEEGGPLRTLILMQKLQAMYRRGVSVEEIRTIYNSKSKKR